MTEARGRLTLVQFKEIVGQVRNRANLTTKEIDQVFDEAWIERKIIEFLESSIATMLAYMPREAAMKTLGDMVNIIDSSYQVVKKGSAVPNKPTTYAKVQEEIKMA